MTVQKKNIELSGKQDIKINLSEFDSNYGKLNDYLSNSLKQKEKENYKSIMSGHRLKLQTAEKNFNSVLKSGFSTDKIINKMIADEKAFFESLSGYVNPAKKDKFNTFVYNWITMKKTNLQKRVDINSKQKKISVLIKDTKIKAYTNKLIAKLGIIKTNDKKITYLNKEITAVGKLKDKDYSAKLQAVLNQKLSELK